MVIVARVDLDCWRAQHPFNISIFDIQLIAFSSQYSSPQEINLAESSPWPILFYLSMRVLRNIAVASVACLPFSLANPLSKRQYGSPMVYGFDEVSEIYQEGEDIVDTEHRSMPQATLNGGLASISSHAQSSSYPWTTRTKQRVRPMCRS
jgi:hypothetical protein